MSNDKPNGRWSKFIADADRASKGNKKRAEIIEYVTRVIDGKEYKVPVYSEGVKRPDVHMKVKG